MLLIIWLISIKKISIPTGTIEKLSIFIGFVFIFNIITTNKNSTAIAPTYTIKNIKEKNSAPRTSSKPATLQKTTIKNNTECTALDSVTTIMADMIEKLPKK
jgi:hypothetical protein